MTYLIFADPQSQRGKDGGSLLPLLPRRKVRTNFSAALVGIGTVMAAAPGLPPLAYTIGDTAIEQGRYADPKVPGKGQIAPQEVLASPPSEKPPTSQQDQLSDVSEVEEEEDIWDAEDDVEAYGRALIKAQDSAKNPTLASLVVPLSPPPLARRNTTSSLQPNSDKARSRHRRAVNSRPNSSTPTLLDISTHGKLREVSHGDLLYQSRLLRSHYLHSEVQFLQTLSSISWVMLFWFQHTLIRYRDRLLVVPKPARVSALRAELTNLNHQLPAEVWRTLF